MSHLLFRGIKTFWKTKSSLDLAIYEFHEHDIYEIIAFDPVIDRHAPRIYVNAKVITKFLNESKGIDGAITTFLFNNIVIVQYLPQSKIIEINMRPIFNEENCNFDSDLLIKPPKNLPFTRSPFGSSQRYVYFRFFYIFKN